MSFILSLLSVFFSGLQQSSFGRASETKDVRKWLTSSARWDPVKMRTHFESSTVSHMILQAPFEVVVMSITLFIVGMGTYLGSSWHENLPLVTGSHGNRAVLIAFIIPTVFVLLMYGHMMGLKDRENLTVPDFDELRSTEEREQLKDGHSINVKAGQQLTAHETSFGQFMSSASDIEGLRLALKEAAEARRRLAHVDMEVASRYERLLRL
jgi:hypothetical protein